MMYEVRLKSTFVRFVIAFLVVQVLLVFFFFENPENQKVFRNQISVLNCHCTEISVLE